MCHSDSVRLQESCCEFRYVFDVGQDNPFVLLLGFGVSVPSRHYAPSDVVWWIIVPAECSHEVVFFFPPRLHRVAMSACPVEKRPDAAFLMTLMVIAVEIEYLICVCFLAINRCLQRTIVLSGDEYIQECQLVIVFSLDGEADATEDTVDQPMCSFNILALEYYERVTHVAHP